MIENYFSLPLFIEVNEKYDLFYDEIEKYSYNWKSGGLYSKNNNLAKK